MNEKHASLLVSERAREACTANEVGVGHGFEVVLA